MELREDCFERIAHPTPRRGSLHTALRKAKRHVGVKQSTDVSPCRGKSVKAMNNIIYTD
ncbi:MAG: hypothetical protein SPL14_06860 [Candidatus Onthomorpha sp.]|nr:hypothetical protein [Bacteroidales bacterium]MDD7484630.1 hypothetical protein [Bacteroidales bacterium]MDY5699128.1 hypothetical protein [Candidatus Onthomorpha sp.]